MFPQIFPSPGAIGLLQWVRPLSEKAAQAEAGEPGEARREDRGVAGNRGRVVDGLCDFHGFHHGIVGEIYGFYGDLTVITCMELWNFERV